MLAVLGAEDAVGRRGSDRIWSTLTTAPLEPPGKTNPHSEDDHHPGCGTPRPQYGVDFCDDSLRRICSRSGPLYPKTGPRDTWRQAPCTGLRHNNAQSSRFSSAYIQEPSLIQKAYMSAGNRDRPVGPCLTYATSIPEWVIVKHDRSDHLGALVRWLSPIQTGRSHHSMDRPCPGQTEQIVRTTIIFSVRVLGLKPREGLPAAGHGASLLCSGIRPIWAPLGPGARGREPSSGDRCSGYP